jgi:hypothetical protein
MYQRFGTEDNGKRSGLLMPTVADPDLVPCHAAAARRHAPLHRAAVKFRFEQDRTPVRRVSPPLSERWVTLRRGFAQWILVPLVALLWPGCPLQYWASCDCLKCSCVPGTALLDVAVHLLEEGLQPCCCRNN